MMCQDFEIQAQPLVRPPQAGKLLALSSDHRIIATTLIQVRSFEPASYRLWRWLELTGEGLSAATSPDSLDHLLPVFRHIR